MMEQGPGEPPSFPGWTLRVCPSAVTHARGGNRDLDHAVCTETKQEKQRPHLVVWASWAAPP